MGVRVRAWELGLGHAEAEPQRRHHRVLLLRVSHGTFGGSLVGVEDSLRGSARARVRARVRIGV